MDFKYKTSFAGKIRALPSEDGKVATASLSELAKWLPNVDTSVNTDLLPVSFDAAVANRANKNGDIMDTEVALRTIKSFVNKFINLSHNRKLVRGVILNYGFSEFGTNKPLTEDEVRGLNGKPWNMICAGVIWRVVDKELADYIEELSNLNGKTEEFLAASWEIGFNDNTILVTEGNSKDIQDGIVIGVDDVNFERYSSALIMNGGSGKIDGFNVYRNISSPALALGIGLTENPAAEVKHIRVLSSAEMEHEDDCNCEDCSETNKSFSKVTYQDKELYNRVRKDADEKFGGDNSYVKNLWVLREYKKRGGKTKFSGKKPNSDEIKKSVKSEEIHSEMDEYDNDMEESEAAEKVNKTLNKPFRTPNGPKKFAVYVRNKKGNIVKVNFGDPNMSIKRDDPERRKSFRARHNCDEKKDKTTPGYWSCKMWSKKPVSDIT